ncbi:hypothetical protein EBR25_01930 [bacterium]|nr:hypothetical protein [bacterium]
MTHVNKRLCVYCFAAVVMSLLMMGCSDVPVAEDISQDQAREVVAVLSKNGIEASFTRKRRGVGNFLVEVAPRDFSTAIRILHEKGIPESSRSEVLSTLSTSSFLPDSRMVEAVRLDFARSLQIESLLENLPDVASARVVLRLHSERPAKKTNTDDLQVVKEDRGASVVLKVKDASLAPRSEIQALLQSIIPELEADRIHLAIFSHEPEGEGVSEASLDGEKFDWVELFFGWKVAAADYPAIVLSLLGVLVLVAVAGIFGGYWFGVITTASRGQMSSLDSFRNGEPLQLQPFDVRDDDRRSQL